MRSRWKGTYSDERFDLALMAQKIKSKRVLALPARNSTILSVFVGRRVLVPNGRRFNRYTVKPFMVGHKFGEYAPTKPMGRAMHLVKRKKKK